MLPALNPYKLHKKAAPRSGAASFTKPCLQQLLNYYFLCIVVDAVGTN
jgi:hypothetical protein